MITFILKVQVRQKTFLAQNTPVESTLEDYIF